MKTFLVILLIIGLGAFGYYQYNHNQQISSQVSIDIPATDQDQIVNTTKEAAQKITNTSVGDQWRAMSSVDLLTISSKENLGLSAITLTQTVDLTGDGIDEGIFTGNGGNSGVTFFLIKNDTTISVARQKNKDGSIHPVALEYVGRAMVSENFKLLPSEKGFYTVSLSFDEDADSSDSSHFKCNTNSVQAYQWNSSTKLFEWNQALTTKYTAEVCK